MAKPAMSHTLCTIVFAEYLLQNGSDAHIVQKLLGAFGRGRHGDLHAPDAPGRHGGVQSAEPAVFGRRADDLSDRSRPVPGLAWRDRKLTFVG